MQFDILDNFEKFLRTKDACQKFFSAAEQRNSFTGFTAKNDHLVFPNPTCKIKV